MCSSFPGYCGSPRQLTIQSLDCHHILFHISGFFFDQIAAEQNVTVLMCIAFKQLNYNSLKRHHGLISISATGVDLQHLKMTSIDEPGLYDQLVSFPDQSKSTDLLKTPRLIASGTFCIAVRFLEATGLRG